MNKKSKPVKNIKVSDDILLKEMEYSDAPDIFHTIDSQREYLGEWLPFVHTTLKMEDTEAFVDSALNRPEEFREYTFVIHYRDRFAGLAGFRDTDRSNQRTEIGYWLSEDLQKKGIVTSSVKSLMDFAFNELDMNRIQIRCAVGNYRSSNIPKNLDFKFEGIEREGEKKYDGTFADIEVYSKLKKDYEL